MDDDYCGSTDSEGYDREDQPVVCKTTVFFDVCFTLLNLSDQAFLTGDCPFTGLYPLPVI